MNLKHISKWIQQEEMEKILSDKKIKSWLLEQGPITNRIKLKHKFELKLLRDSAGKVEISDKSFLDNVDGEIRIREVILFADENPKVFARSLIPENTIKNGLKKLGELNTKPLGDILFEKNIFQKQVQLLLKLTKLMLQQQKHHKPEKYNCKILDIYPS